MSGVLDELDVLLREVLDGFLTGRVGVLADLTLTVGGDDEHRPLLVRATVRDRARHLGVVVDGGPGHRLSRLRAGRDDGRGVGLGVGVDMSLTCFLIGRTGGLADHSIIA